MLGLGVGFYGLAGNDIVEDTSLTGIAGANLALWYKFNTGITANESDEVSKWDDQSGNGRHATQSVDANKATLVNGSLDFEESNSDHYDFTNIQIADQGGFCFAAVITPEDTGLSISVANSTILGKTNPAQHHVFKLQDTGVFLFRSGLNASTVETQFHFEENTFTPNKMLLVLNRSRGATNVFTFMKNGNTLTPDTDNSVNEANGENAIGFDIDTLSGRTGSSQFFDGIMHEVAFWDDGLDATQLAAVNSYLKDKHGL